MSIDGKYGVINAEKKNFHPGEPVFLIRAQDGLAAGAVLAYAHDCFLAGCDWSHVEQCLEHAKRIVAWQKANPGLVKHRPD